ncbi:MAG TPA: carbamoyl-phosphate synthase small subunit, partial [Gaiellaceae bacterium]
GIVALTGIDTRSLVLKIRDLGSMRAVAVAGPGSVEEAVEAARSLPEMEGRALAAGVSTNERYTFAEEGRVRVAVVDYGVKNSVLRRLAAAGAAVDVHPHDVAADVLAGYDGVLFSPGPGDPGPLGAETETMRELLGRTNVLGICLGHQVLAMATGHETFKLPFGHRGANHPVLQRANQRVLVTSQNHGFAVRPAEGEQATHVSLYDGTVEGLAFPELRARSLQFHPEAGPGPHDAWPLLETWVDDVAA